MLPPKLIPHISQKELETLYRQEKDAKLARKYLTILEVYRTNLYPNLLKIGAQLCVSPKTIGNWVRAWNKEGVQGLKTKKQSGRPSLLTREEVDQIIFTVEAHPRDLGFNFSTWSLKKIKRYISDTFGKDVSLSVLSRTFKRERIAQIVPRTMPVKGDPEKKKNLEGN